MKTWKSPPVRMLLPPEALQANLASEFVSGFMAYPR